MISHPILFICCLGTFNISFFFYRYLDRAISDSAGIRKQDAPRVFAAVSNNPIGNMLAFNFIREHWDRVKT